jgi:hypothetical protein
MSQCVCAHECTQTRTRAGLIPHGNQSAAMVLLPGLIASVIIRLLTPAQDMDGYNECAVQAQLCSIPGCPDPLDATLECQEKFLPTAPLPVTIALSLISGSAVMVLLGKSRSELQRKCAVPDEGNKNFIMYNPVTSMCCTTCLLCQVRACPPATLTTDARSVMWVYCRASG